MGRWKLRDRDEGMETALMIQRLRTRKGSQKPGFPIASLCSSPEDTRKDATKGPP